MRMTWIIRATLMILGSTTLAWSLPLCGNEDGKVCREGLSAQAATVEAFLAALVVDPLEESRRAEAEEDMQNAQGNFAEAAGSDCDRASQRDEKGVRDMRNGVVRMLLLTLGGESLMQRDAHAVDTALMLVSALDTHLASLEALGVPAEDLDDAHKRLRDAKRACGSVENCPRPGRASELVKNGIDQISDFNCP